MLAQRCKHSQSTRKRNGEAFPEGNTASYLIFQINYGLNGGWCGKYSTSSANKPVHTAEARASASHCFSHKHVLLFRKTVQSTFSKFSFYSIWSFSYFSSSPLNKKNLNQKLCNWSKINVCQINYEFVISFWKISRGGWNACKNPHFSHLISSKNCQNPWVIFNVIDIKCLWSIINALSLSRSHGIELSSPNCKELLVPLPTMTDKIRIYRFPADHNLPIWQWNMLSWAVSNFFFFFLHPLGRLYLIGPHFLLNSSSSYEVLCLYPTYWPDKHLEKAKYRQ